MRRKRNDESLDALQAEIGESTSPSDLKAKAEEAAAKYDAGWRPNLTLTQAQAFNDRTAKYMLLDAERGTGKTVVALDKLIDHCFNNHNAMACILVRESSMAKDGGAWDKLLNRNLDIWKNGNINEKTGERLDAGIGLEFTPPKYDVERKKPFIWIMNRFGGWGKVICISLNIGAHVHDKIKGPEYSFVLVEEAQTTEGDDYFVEVVQQVGRRQGIDWIQQIVYTANPKGPSHWLYKQFFEIPVDEETGEWNTDYARYHIPLSENIDNLPAGYYDRVMEACRNNPVLYARNVKGEWVDIPEGEAIFKDVFSALLHVKGDYAKKEGLIPLPGYNIICGYDLGSAHSSIHFMQAVPNVEGRLMWRVFDELNFVGHYMAYKALVPKIMARMDYWDTFNGPYTWEHVSDDSAFNQLRPDGSYDVQIVEQLSGGRIKLKAAPKGPGSVPARVRLVSELLSREELIVSAMCTKTIQMFTLMESKREKEYNEFEGLIPKKGPFVHVLDSLSYPIFRAHTMGMGYLMDRTSRMEENRVIQCGR